ncbi:MAG: sulfate transporter family protein [Mesorhizobium amorphae]|nr:MAG: sulfate transporter family protein [Mesorhizobium amorphae]
MIASALSDALATMFRPEFRGTFLKTLGVTILVLLAAWFGLKELFDWLVMPWVATGVGDLPAWASFLAPLAAILAGIALAIGLGLLLAPTTALVAGLFLDGIAEAIERQDYPQDRPGEALPAGTALAQSVKFLGVVVLGNLLALFLLLVPGINLFAFLLVNAYLLGREFFEFAAMRFHSIPEAQALRRRHAGTVFLAGLLIAGLLAIPVLNLAAPLFAASLMVHLHKRIARSEARKLR